MIYVQRGLYVVLLLCVLCLPEAGWRAVADEPTASAEVARLVVQLDALAYDDRQLARAEIQALLEDAQLRPAAVLQLQTMLARENLSLEVRETLKELIAPWPAPADLSPPIDPALAPELLKELADSRFIVRVRAVDQLRRLSQQPGQASRLLTALKLLQDENPSAGLQSLAADVSADVRRAWLTSDPADWQPNPLTDEQIALWLREIIAQAVESPHADDLPDPLAAAGQPIIIVGNGFNAMTVDRPGGFVRGDPWAFSLLSAATNPPSQRWPRQTALREFVDAAFYDENVPQLREAVQAALADDQDLSEAALQQLEQLEELLMPTLVAEMWKERMVVTVQFLFVDVPQFPEYATRPTHFDRIDDEIAHCVSGNSLVPGEYPVNRAIAPTHPDRDPNNPDNLMCIRLLNLETPRRRMQYLYDLQRSLAERLLEFSERSCAGWLAERRLLTERESLALMQLEPAVVSQFIGPYLQQVDDKVLPKDRELSLFGSTSSHALTCFVVSTIGDYAAFEGIRTAVDDGRIRQVQDTEFYDLTWIALIELAGRVACPDAEADRDFDAWLVQLMDDKTPLLPGGGDSGPELGATAAAILLLRHGQEPAEFDLSETPVAPALGLSGQYYRFLLPGGRDRVHTWWEQQKSELALAH